VVLVFHKPILFNITIVIYMLPVVKKNARACLLPATEMYADFNLVNYRYLLLNISRAAKPSVIVNCLPVKRTII
jgi:hypothetical protein